MQRNDYDMIIIGGGISGLATAHYCRKAGERALLLEAADRLGGCIRTHTLSGYGARFWLELGTHTCFNSYGRLLAMLSELGLLGELQKRERLPYRLFTRDGIVSIWPLIHFGELIMNLPRRFSLPKEGRTVADYYRALLGPRNYGLIFGPAFNAVICQRAAEVPASMLFRKRPRDRSVLRSFTFADGLQALVERLAQQCDVRLQSPVQRIERVESGWRVVTDNGEFTARRLTLATPVAAASQLLRTTLPEISAELAAIGEVEVESVGVVIKRELLNLDRIAGIIAQEDLFWSVVSRDVVGHPRVRGLTFHFKPGALGDEAKLKRIGSVLGIDRMRFSDVVFKTNRLPVPRLGHDRRIAAIDRLLADQPLALTGNYFAGVAIEDCLERTENEFSRLRALA